jgi:hypothetical protein
MSTTTEDLFDFSEAQLEAFKNAETKEKGGKKDDPPDGKYQVQVMKVALERSKEGKRKMNWHFKILNGKNKGQYLFKNGMVDTDVGLMYMKNDLVSCGLNIELSELKDSLPLLLDRKLEVVKKTGKDPKFYNLYINSLLEDGDPLDEEGSDDIPF